MTGIDAIADVSTFPELVYLPCAEHVAEPEDARPLVRHTEDGMTVMSVYSTERQLYRSWGRDHPWLALRSDRLEAMRAARLFDLAVLDLHEKPE